MRALSMRRAPEKNEADVEQPAQGGFGGATPETQRSDTEGEELLTQRRVFVNQPLPEDLLDEDGSPLQSFSRNKIRTAKYTPLIFIPKNLWLQFQNIANVYFLFVTILAVRALAPIVIERQLIMCRSFPSLELRIRRLVPSPSSSSY